jgi:YggT family protein
MVSLVFTVLNLAILGRILLSWVDPSPFPDNPLKRILWFLTDPILVPLRRIIPPIGMFDITPIAAIVLLQVLQQIAMAVLGGQSGVSFH